jgi:anti-sigma regulatory factor (Ser/Thr protein kinase)
MRSLVFDSCDGNALRLSFAHDIDIRDTLAIIRKLRFPETGMTDEQLSIALIELVTNSLRAQAERHAREPVLMDIRSDALELAVEVTDHGGGFDLAALPFDLNKPVEDIDPTAAPFSEYRRIHRYARFGMGLVLVRRTFQFFRLAFVDSLGRELAWPSPEIVGTVISLRSAIQRGERPESPGDQRGSRRDLCLARACLLGPDALGHVVDISEEGLRIRFITPLREWRQDDCRLLLSMSEIGIAPFTIGMNPMWRADKNNSTIVGMKLRADMDEAGRAGFGALRKYYESKSAEITIDGRSSGS